MSWLRTRRLIYTRDRGICQVCLLHVGHLWDAGHLVDRGVGGTDVLSNLVLMCVRCNRTDKPLHRTRDEALAWLRERRRLARGYPLTVDWRPFYEAMYGRKVMT